MSETAFGSLRVDSGTVKPYAPRSLNHYSAGGQTTGVKKQQWLVSSACQIVGVRARLDTAPVGAAAILDLNINGTTAYTTQGNRPTIADGANVSSTTLPDVVTLAAGDRVSYDVDQVGSGTAGSDLSVSILVKQLTTD